MPATQDEHAQDWLAEELAEALDEDFELELEDAALSREIAKIYKDRHPEALDRKTYLTSLIHMAHLGMTQLLALTLQWLSLSHH